MMTKATCAALLALCFVLGMGGRVLLAKERLRGQYRIEVDRSAGAVAVTVRLSASEGRGIELFSLLGDDIVSLSELSAADAAGRALGVVRCPDRRRGAKYSRYRVEPSDAEPIVVRYRTTPEPYRPPDDRNETRQCAMLREGGCAFALPNLMLLPDEPFAELEFTAVLPPEWAVAVPLPDRLERPTLDALWECSLVAGNYPGVAEALLPRVDFLPFGEPAAGVGSAVRRIVEELARILGDPLEPIEIVGAPFEDGAPPTELPGWSRTALVDLRGMDPESLRRVIRLVVPLWLGRKPAEVWLAGERDAWFALGLCEYLALTLPVRLGLVARDAEAGLEWTWMMQPALHGLDPADTGKPLSQRLIVATSLAYEFVLRAGRAGVPIEEWLRRWDGRGYPEAASAEQEALLRSFEDEVTTNRSRKLSFEPDWEIQLASVPSRPTENVASILTIGFTGDCAGYLEGCGCKQKQSGGIAHKADFARKLAKEKPGLLLVELGNFSAVENGRARLDPIGLEEAALYVEGLAVMDYDAVCFGPDEAYSRSPLLRSSTKLPLVGLGIRVDGRDICPSSRILAKGGLRIGFIGYSELLENGWRQAQEGNMAGVAFPTSPSALLEEVRVLRPRVDVLVVGGRMRPSTLRELCAPGSGVDAVLVAGYQQYEGLHGGIAGFIHDTAVAFESAQYYGFNVLSLFLSSRNRPQGLDLDPRLIDRAAPVDAEVQALIDRFSADLGNRPELHEGLKPLFERDPWHRDDYVGAESCLACHASQFQQWKSTPHATAMQTLVAAHRERHPKCVQCHVVGLGSRTGYQMSRPDPRLEGVQCETCHGAGGQHVRSPLESGMRRTPEKSVCLECHDEEHSERFEERFLQAFQAVKH